ncbi:MAG: hypothetical protein H6Q27_546 [Ignavibacteriaceae bacterium]|nr:hypothetical protein [Ignavibacteriaceae bacterium]
MKNILFVMFLVSTTATFAQFKDSGFETNSVKEGIVSENSNALFGFLNSDDFIMRHSFSLNYATSGGQGMSLTSYTNSMFYRLMNNLNVQLDVSVMYSPYSTLGEQFQKDVSGVYISNAALNYHPWDNFSVHLQYRSMPFGYGYYHPFYGYGNPFNFSSGINSYQSESPFENK